MILCIQQNHPSTCCHTFISYRMATIAASVLQSTTSSCFNHTQHQYSKNHTEQVLGIENLKRPRSRKCSEKTSSHPGKLSAQHQSYSCPKKAKLSDFCVDYRMLNNLNIWGSYPIPWLDKCVDSLGEQTIFLALDANGGYWNILFENADGEKTAFKLHHSFYRYIRLPFVWRNASGLSQRTMGVILSIVKWQFGHVHLVSIIVFSMTH